ncbi:MAG: SIMPL domain-containing protein [Flavobacteriales bacterium]|nr:SIMPL domain-containing protein [Flavobacteriales bacterium]
MKTTYFLLAACTLGFTAAHAQSDVSQFADNAIYLVVSDTLPTLSGGIAYDIAPVDEALATMEFSDDMDYEKIQMESNERVKKVREKLEKELKNQKYNVTEAPNGYDPYTISGYESGYSETPALRVELKSEEELKTLVDWLRKRGSVTGSVAEWKKDPAPNALDDLTVRLFNQARAKAERLAVMGGRKLGKLIAAEDYNADSGYGYAYDSGYSSSEPMIRTMRFKFSLVD